MILLELKTTDDDFVPVTVWVESVDANVGAAHVHFVRDGQVIDVHLTDRQAQELGKALLSTVRL